VTLFFTLIGSSSQNSIHKTKERFMLNSKTLMTYLLTLLVGFMMTACPDDDCDESAGDEAAAGSEEEGEEDDSCAEGGDIGGDTAGEVAGDSGGDSGGDSAGDSAGDDMPATAYNHVVVLDNTTDINADGTPGVDICEVDVSCDGSPVADASVVSNLGSSPVCDGTNDVNCVCDGEVVGVCTSGKNRADESLVFDGDASCDGDNWASTGINGYIALEVEGLSECASVDVTVNEKDGEQEESYVVALCDDVANFDFSEMMFGDSCVVIGSAAASGESTFSWEAPAAE
jgi:hypothetical protein